MTKIHLVYPHGSRISTPDAIGRNLAIRLTEKYNYSVIKYNWDESTAIKPGSNDVIIGHPHFKLDTCFRMSYKQKGWKRILVMSPFNTDKMQVAFLEPFLRRCNLYLAITGNYWISQVKDSLFAHWIPKMIHLDLAIDRNDFPILKKRFSVPGERRFVYIGSNSWAKNTDYLSRIASLMPDIKIYWIGAGNKTYGKKINGLIHQGFYDFSKPEAKRILAEHDFMITVGHVDSNPTTILEAMAWGLIPVCTPQSGYVNYPGIVNIPLGNAEKAIEVLCSLQELPEFKLQEMQAFNWEALDTHLNWDRFACQVAEAIESDSNPMLVPISLITRLKIFLSLIRSPYSFIRSRYLTRYFLDKIMKLVV
ncbi:MAG: hypothetical protein ACFFBY_15660 [Promethearchaeota archaeon]